jgi:hypothetical protein
MEESGNLALRQTLEDLQQRALGLTPQQLRMDQRQPGADLRQPERALYDRLTGAESRAIRGENLANEPQFTVGFRESRTRTPIQLTDPFGGTLDESLLYQAQPPRRFSPFYTPQPAVTIQNLRSQTVDEVMGKLPEYRFRAQPENVLRREALRETPFTRDTPASGWRPNVFAYIYGPAGTAREIRRTGRISEAIDFGKRRTINQILNPPVGSLPRDRVVVTQPDREDRPVLATEVIQEQPEYRVMGIPEFDQRVEDFALAQMSRDV